jgi:hypothetical protein
MIVVNGEPFIRYNLENLYPHAHEILIVEGAVEKFRHAATPDGHSLDRTVEIIKNFPDPQGKIKLIQRDGFWPEKDEMSNAYMAICTGDYIWQVDVDEFYKSADIEKIRRLLSENPDIERVDIKTINFWRGFRAVMQGASYIYGADEFIRIFKFKSGYRYLAHRPPTVIDERGCVIGASNILRANELAEVHNVYIYHYSYVFPDAVKNKSAYYSGMSWENGCEEGLKWAEKYWEKFKNPLRIHLIKFPPSWIILFSGNHPEVIEKMIKEINYKENSEIEDFLESEWGKYADVGNRIMDYYTRAEKKQMNRLTAAFSILGCLILPTNGMALRADKTIFEVFSRRLRI